MSSPHHTKSVRLPAIPKRRSFGLNVAMSGRVVSRFPPQTQGSAALHVRAAPTAHERIPQAAATEPMRPVPTATTPYRDLRETTHTPPRRRPECSAENL